MGAGGVGVDGSGSGYVAGGSIRTVGAGAGSMGAGSGIADEADNSDPQASQNSVPSGFLSYPQAEQVMAIAIGTPYR